MASGSVRKSSRDKVSEHRARLRAQGLRPLQIWVPDTRLPTFRAAALSQAMAVAASAASAADQSFIDAISELPDT